jgi:hypothetical protein
MRRVRLLALFTIAAACWLAAGPGGVTLQALLACRHHAMHQAHPGHNGGGAPTDGPCFCDEMTGGSDLAVSTAVPAPPVSLPILSTPSEMATSPSLFPLPPSPFFTPTPPPPNGLG